MNKRERQQQIRAEKEKAAQRKKKLGKMALYAGIGVILLALILALTHNADLEIPGVSEVTANDQVKGYDKAPLTLVEYSDFQCPACRAQHNTIRSAWKEVRRKVKIVYRHFPLTKLHPHAHLAAHYAEAAGKQDKFWEMHDRLFDTQSTWSGLDDPTAKFTEYAEKLGLDLEQLQQDIESDAVKDKVRADTLSGRKAGVKSTPTLFLEGELLSNVRGRQSFIDEITNAADLK